jgi:hypothetical protein
MEWEERLLSPTNNMIKPVIYSPMSNASDSSGEAGGVIIVTPETLPIQPPAAFVEAMRKQNLQSAVVDFGNCGIVTINSTWFVQMWSAIAARNVALGTGSANIHLPENVIDQGSLNNLLADVASVAEANNWLGLDLIADGFGMPVLPLSVDRFIATLNLGQFEFILDVQANSWVSGAAGLHMTRNMADEWELLDGSNSLLAHSAAGSPTVPYNSDWQTWVATSSGGYEVIADFGRFNEFVRRLETLGWLVQLNS